MTDAVGTLSGEQQWVLAMGALLNKQNGRRLDRLGGEGRPTVSWQAASVLRKGWNVHLPSDAERSLTWLLDGGGHRVQYEAAGVGSAASFAGWDAARACNVAGWAYAAYLMDLETAWAWQRKAAALAQQSFGSWAEVGRSYVRGLSEWCEGARDVLDPSEAAAAWLCSDPSSPWVTLPFGLALGTPPPPAPPTTEVVVGEGEAKTIADAVRLAGVDGRVIVPAGTYRESLVLPHSVEIEARGEVTLESAGKPTVFVEGTRGVRLQGITLRSGRTEGGDSLNAVRVLRGYARIERCDIAATHDGIQLNNWSSVHVVDSTIHDCGSIGVNQISGQLIAERTTVKSARMEGFKLAGEAPSFLRECRVEGTGTAGILLLEKARAQIALTEVSGCGGSASVAAVGNAVILLDRCSISGGKGGVFFMEAAGGVVAETRITGCALAALDVASTRPVRAEQLTIVNNAASGVLVRGGARVVVTDSTLDASAQGHVWVMTDGQLAFLGGAVIGGALGFWAQAGGVLHVHHVVIEKQTGPAVDAQPGSRVNVALGHIRGATGDGVVVGEGAEVVLSLVRIEGVGGAPAKVAPGGKLRLEGVTLSGDVIGEVTTAALADDEATQRALDERIDGVLRDLLG